MVTVLATNGKGSERERPTLLSRFRGCLIGLAVGDAVGTTVEFQPPKSFPPVTDMEGGGKFNLEPGQWTDDTSMALCMAESLIELGAYRPVDLCERFWRWYEDGHLSSTGQCFDIGMTTQKALHAFNRRGRQEGNGYCGPTTSRAAGNGSLMRLCPVPLAFWRHPRLAMDLSGDSSRMTHGATQAIDACRFFAGLLVGCLQGFSKDELLSSQCSPVPSYWEENTMHEEVRAVAKGSFKVSQPPEIAGTGYVVKSMEAALWAFFHTDTFKDGCLKAVNLGDDADTTAAIYGQIAGAYYGEEGIPLEWRKRVMFLPLLQLMADELCLMADKVTPPTWPLDKPHEKSYEASEKYCALKKTGYNLLEGQLHKIIRHMQPGPHAYKSLPKAEQDVDEMKKLYCDLPDNCKDEGMLQSVLNLLKPWTEKLKQRLGRRGM